MDRDDSRAAPAVDHIIRNLNLRLIQATFHRPSSGRTFKQVAETCLGDAVPVLLKGPWVPWTQRHKAEDAKKPIRMNTHLALVLVGDVAYLDPKFRVGAFAAKIDAERLIADFHCGCAFRQQCAVDPLPLDQPAFVVVDILEPLTRFRKQLDRHVQGGWLGLIGLGHRRGCEHDTRQNDSDERKTS